MMSQTYRPISAKCFGYEGQPKGLRFSVLESQALKLIPDTILGNFLSILVLYRRDMDLKPIFREILITLISFDVFCIIFNILVFCLPHLSANFFKHVFPYIVPYVLPCAQIALTGNSTKSGTLTIESTLCRI